MIAYVRFRVRWLTISSFYNFQWRWRSAAVVFVTGRSVADHATVPVHRLAGTRSSQVRRRIHRLRRPGAQDQGTVRSGRTNHRSLQVNRLVLLVRLLINLRQIDLLVLIDYLWYQFIKLSMKCFGTSCVRCRYISCINAYRPFLFCVYWFCQLGLVQSVWIVDCYLLYFFTFISFSVHAVTQIFIVLFQRAADSPGSCSLLTASCAGLVLSKQINKIISYTGYKPLNVANVCGALEKLCFVGLTVFWRL